eukprot:scaffold77215_cov18-Prasinocladus_malaysianus.AAC.1
MPSRAFKSTDTLKWYTSEGTPQYANLNDVPIPGDYRCCSKGPLCAAYGRLLGMGATALVRGMYKQVLSLSVAADGDRFPALLVICSDRILAM